MSRSWSGLASRRFAAVALLSLGALASALAQAPAPATPPAAGQTSPAAQASGQPPPTPPTKSVYGKLLSVDTSSNNVLMTEDSGAQLAWRFDATIVAEAAKFKAGDPVIVIYRQIGPGPKDKRVTAIAFPGSAKSPIYTNLTSERVVVRSAAGVGGSCSQTAGPVSESTIPVRGLAWWLRGVPHPGTPHEVERDTAARASLLRQDGWEIVLGYGESSDRPSRIRLAYPDTELRLAIDAWSDGP